MNRPTSPAARSLLSRSRVCSSSILFPSLLLTSLGAEPAQASLPSPPRASRAAIELQEEQSDGSTSTDITPDKEEVVASQLPEELQTWLNQVAELQERGDLDGAREHLSGIVMSEAFAELLGSQEVAVLVGLEEIDARAATLGLVELQSVVREECHRRLSKSLDRDHPDLLRAKQNLSATRYALGDLPGTLELEEYLHSARERLLPADHPELLDAKQNLAVTRAVSGDMAGALELFEEVHGAIVKLLPAEHPQLLLIKQNLGSARKAMGDLWGAHELFEVVHRERAHTLPADHPQLIDAKQNLALTLKALGDLNGALELELLIHDARSRSLPAEHPTLLAAKLNLAVTLKNLGDLEGALELEEFAHEVRERTLPAEHPDLLIAKQNLAATRHALGDLEGAHQLFEFVHAVRERALPAEHPDLIAAKMNLAGTRESLGDLEGALELYEFVHDVRIRTLPPDHPDLLSAKQNLGGARRTAGDLEGAHELFETLHAARRLLLPPDHPDLLAAKQNLALTRGALGDLAGALELDEFVHESRSRLLPADHPHLIAAKLNLAGARKAMGDLRGALELEELVHASRTRLLPADHPDLLNAKLSLAVTRRAMGDIGASLELEEWVLRARTRLLPADHPDLLRTQQHLAITRGALGDMDGALELEEIVHNQWARVLRADHPDLLRAKQNLAATRKARGDLEGAVELERTVHDARERLLPANHPELLGVKLNLAITLERLGNQRGALELYEEVRSAQEEVLPAEHPDLLLTYQNLAGLRVALGDLEGARELYESVYEARLGSFPAEHPDLLDATQNLAGVQTVLGETESAHRHLSSLLSGQETRAQLLSREAPRVARAMARVELDRFSANLFLSGSDEPEASAQFAPRLFQLLGLLRGVSIGSGATVRAASRRPELAELLESLERSRAAVADHRLSAPSLGDGSGSEELQLWRVELFRLAESRDALEKEVRGLLADARLESATPSANHVAASLEPDAVLFDYFRYQRYTGPNEQTGEMLPPVDSLLAFVISKSGSVQRVDLGPSAELERMVRQWRMAIGHSVGTARGDAEGSEARGVTVGTGLANEEDERRLGNALRERLLNPCLAVLGEKLPSEIHLVLDEFQHLLPFDALPWTDEKRVGDVFKIHQAISSQRLAIGTEKFIGDGNLLALGGVDYAAQDVREAQLSYPTATPPTGLRYPSEHSAPKEAFAPLRQTRIEVEELGRMYKDMAGGESVILSGAKATKLALFETAPAARYLHLATHGWFAPETFVSTLDSLEEQSGDAFASLARADDVVRGFAPETLCGLALAGANHGTNSAGKVPGILTAEELGALDLSNCELAVLSACETNVGLRRAGQGIQSLQMALHTAGARTAITSLWRVDDAATRRLMELFYTNLWGEGLGKADALWQAKMSLREEGFGVKDWAAWVLTGDPR